jgi:hypothetical protein
VNIFLVAAIASSPIFITRLLIAWRPGILRDAAVWCV